MEFNPDTLYAPVASHECIRLVMNLSASEGLHLEGCDVDKAYVSGLIEIPIVMKQPADLSQKLAWTGYASLLVRSLYGARQAGRICGSSLHDKLKFWGLQQSTIEQRLYGR